MWATTGGSGEHQRVSRHMCYALAATGRGVLVAAPHVGAAGGPILGPAALQSFCLVVTWISSSSASCSLLRFRWALTCVSSVHGLSTFTPIEASAPTLSKLCSFQLLRLADAWATPASSVQICVYSEPGSPTC